MIRSILGLPVAQANDECQRCQVFGGRLPQAASRVFREDAGCPAASVRRGSVPALGRNVRMSMQSRIVAVVASLGALAIAIAWLTPVMPSYQRTRLSQKEREELRRVAFHRLEAAGGWEVLRHECEALFADHVQVFDWRLRDGLSTLPPTLRVLQPLYVRGVAEKGSVPVVQVKIAGAYSTGTRTRLYYGLYVVCGSTPPGITSWLLKGDASMSKRFERITNGVFELF